MPTGYLVSLGDTSLDVNDTINATPVTFTTFSTIGAGGWRWTGVWSGNGNSYSNISDTGVFYEGTDGNVYFIPDTWTTLSGTAVVTSAPSYTAPNYVNGTGLADVIDTSYTDSDGDQVDGGDGTGVAGNEDTISAGDGNDTVDAGAEDDIVYGGGGGDSIDGGTGADTLYGDTDDISPGGVDGSDTISGGAGDDVIYGEGGGDSLFGDAGSDNITGGAGDDTISGGADDDTLTGGIGDDSIDGDAGDDFIGG
ncbi:calcium-binding protein, partial [Planktotalea sp.]|uniref:calcium-binding protein n=1 Tax=Planktotalea sp. TaxID=2029877 RepID=UPI00329A7165